MDRGLTTVQIKKVVRDKLREIADFNERSMAGYLTWLVNREYKQYEYERYQLTERGRQALKEIEGE